jgi:hypothetical protein
MLGALALTLAAGSIAGTVIDAFDGPPPKLGKNEDILGAVSRLERRCRELRADAHRVSSAPFPLSFARERLREIVQTWAQQGAPNCSPLIEHEHGEIAWPTRTLRSQIFNVEAHGRSPLPRSRQWCRCWLFCSVICWSSGSTPCLPRRRTTRRRCQVSERQEQAARIASDLLSVERDLCFWVWRGLDDKLPVWFPAETSTIAIVGA